MSSQNGLQLLLEALNLLLTAMAKLCLWSFCFLAMGEETIDRNPTGGLEDWGTEGLAGT